MLHKYKVVDQRSQYCNAPLSTRSKAGQRGLATHVIRRALIAVSIVVAMAGPVGLAQPATTSHRYQGLVGWLASPQMEGRGPGTAGLDLARDFIARYFLDIDLKPAFGANTLGYGRAYTQQFEISLGVEVKQQSLQLRVGEHAFENAGSASEDYNTLGFSANGSFDGSVVFVGYGIVEPDFDYNSYVGVSKDMLADKVVVVFRYEPRGKDGRSRWSGKKGRGGPWSKAADLARKASWAQNKRTGWSTHALQPGELRLRPPGLTRSSPEGSSTCVSGGVSTNRYRYPVCVWVRYFSYPKKSQRFAQFLFLLC